MAHIFKNGEGEQVIRMPSLKHCNMEQMNISSCKLSLITYNCEHADDTRLPFMKQLFKCDKWKWTFIRRFKRFKNGLSDKTGIHFMSVQWHNIHLHQGLATLASPWYNWERKLTWCSPLGKNTEMVYSSILPLMPLTLLSGYCIIFYVVWFEFMPINVKFVCQFLPMDSEND